MSSIERLRDLDRRKLGDGGPGEIDLVPAVLLVGPNENVRS